MMLLYQNLIYHKMIYLNIFRRPKDPIKAKYKNETFFQCIRVGSSDGNFDHLHEVLG